MTRLLSLLALVFGIGGVRADDVLDIVPAPMRFEPAAGRFGLPPAGQVGYLGDLTAAVADEIARRAGAATRGSWRAVRDAADAPIVVEIGAVAGATGSEAYEISATPERVRLRGASAAGCFYAAQTLLQLLDLLPVSEPRPERTAHSMACGTITDAPRFGHRGLLLDAGRHVIPIDMVKRYLDLMALHKLNVLHWHLTEDQGWRIEIRRYPELTEIGAWRKATRESEQPRDPEGRYGGFYTQAEVREIVAYAAARHIRVVPEIELPGHSGAALAARPELSCTGGPFEVVTAWGVHEDIYCAGNDATFEFLENVLSEVIELFPSELIHIGGDEAPKARWKKCPKCQARMKAEGLRSEEELQSYFVRRIGRFLESKGRRLVGWDEILEGGLAENAIVQSWRGTRGAIEAARAGHDVVMSPTSHCYLDYAQGDGVGEPRFMGFIPLERVYEFEPLPPELPAAEARHILGGEGALWTEHASPALLDRQAFPRLSALAEVFWSPRDSRNWGGFQTRLRTHTKRLESLGVRYYVAPPRIRAVDSTFVDTLDVEVIHDGEGGLRVTLDGSDPRSGPVKSNSAIRLSESATVRAVIVLPGGNTSPEARSEFRKLAWHSGVQTLRSAPGVAWACYEGDWRRLPDFSALTPVKEGTAERIDLSVRTREDKFALRFGGFLSVAKDGIYTFHVRSDDGARLTVHDERVVDHDGEHAATWKSGRVLLRAGLHPFSLEYFDAGGADALAIEVEGPGLARGAPAPASLTH